MVSFQDQEKLLHEKVFSLAVSMNANTKNSQIKHCPYLKYVLIKKPNPHNLKTRKNIWKLTKSSNLSFKLYHHKKPLISTLPKNLRSSELRCIICRQNLYNLKTRKKLKKYLIVRTELSLFRLKHVQKHQI